MNKNELQIFKNTEFGELEILSIDGKEYFPASKCAAILGYASPKDAISRHCKGAIKQRLPTSSGMQDVKYIPEGDLYRLIVCSKLPKAEEFEHWIFDEVLPSIRKHGAYLTPETIKKTLADPDYIIGIISALKAEQDRNAKLTTTVENLNNSVKSLTEETAVKDKVISRQSTEIEQAKPKVEFYDTVADANGNLSMAEYAKLLCKNGANVGRNRIFSWFKDNGYLMSNNEPYQQYVNAGYFYVHEYTLYIKGIPSVGTKTLITGKGQQYFYKKIIHDFTKIEQNTKIV